MGDNLKSVATVGEKSIGTWASSVNDNITQNKIVHSNDLKITKTSTGTRIGLRNQYKQNRSCLVYRGEWNPDGYYAVNDVVTVMPEQEYFYFSDQLNPIEDFSPGVWICVANVPDKRLSDHLDDTPANDPYIRWDDTNYNPIWPYPKQDLSEDKGGEDGNYWEMLGMLPTRQAFCDPLEGEKIYYIGAIPSGSNATIQV